jgi:hypothetical protein
MHPNEYDCICKDKSYLDSDEFTVAPIEETTFLISLNNSLEELKEQCKRAIEWSDESSELFDSTFDAFKKIMDICEDAGLPVAFEDSPMIQDEPLRLNSLVFPDSIYNSFDPPMITTASHKSHTTTRAKQDSTDKKKEVLHSYIDQSNGVDDSRMSRFWKEKYFENEMTRIALAQRQEERINSLEDSLKNSIVATLSVQKQVEEQNRKLYNLQEHFGESQKMVQHAMSEQVNYWKNICDDLSYEKRKMGKQLAIQRQKNTALKDHIALLLGKSSGSLKINQLADDDFFCDKSQNHPSSSEKLSLHKTNARRKKQYDSDPESDSSLTSNESSKEFVILQGPEHLANNTSSSQQKGSEMSKSSVASTPSSDIQMEVLQSNFRRFYLSSSRGKPKV